MTLSVSQAKATEREEIWKASVARYNAARRNANRWAWVRYFDRMAANHARLSEEYERRAEELCEDERKGARGLWPPQ